MKANSSSFWEWQKRYSDGASFFAGIFQLCWPEGFQCIHYGRNRGWQLNTRPVIECSHCHHQISITAGTLFHADKILLARRFRAVYWVSSDKGSVSALCLSKLSCVY